MGGPSGRGAVCVWKQFRNMVCKIDMLSAMFGGQSWADTSVEILN